MIRSRVRVLAVVAAFLAVTLMNGVVVAADSATEEQTPAPEYDAIPEPETVNWETADASSQDDGEMGVLCHPRVSVDARHAPAGQWSAHGHPLFSWSKTCGHKVVKYRVDATWRPAFDTTSTSWHTNAPEGGQRVAVNTLYTYTTRHWHWCCWYHTHHHYYWGGWSYSPTVYLDQSAPTVSSTVDAPVVHDGGQTFVTSDSTFKVHASDRYSGVKSVEHRFDAEVWTPGSTAHATGLADGAHTLHARATDNVGWSSTRALDFVLDNTAPAITMMHPTPFSVNADRLSAEACTDNPRVTIGEETLAEVERPVNEELPPLPPGSPDVIAAGPASCEGRVAETTPLVVPGQQVDVPEDVDTPPEVPAGTEDTTALEAQSVTFVAPVIMTGVVPVVADVQDALVGTSEVSLVVNDVVYETQSGANGVFSFNWDTTTERAGEHTLAVRATDRLGNTVEFAFHVIVATQTEEGLAATVAHGLTEAEDTRTDAEADAAAAVADALGTADGATAEAEAAAITEACNAAGVWAQFVPQCSDE